MLPKDPKNQRKRSNKMQKGQCPKAVHLTEGSRWHESKCKGPTEEKRYDMWSFQGLSISPSNWRCFSDPLNVWCWILSMGTRYNLMFSAPEGLSLSQKKHDVIVVKHFLVIQSCFHWFSNKLTFFCGMGFVLTTPGLELLMHWSGYQFIGCKIQTPCIC